MKVSGSRLAIPLLLTISSVAQADVKDKAGLFSPDVVRKANAMIEELERNSGVPITVETVTSIGDVPVEEAVIQQGRREGAKGLFILIPARQHKVETASSPGYKKYFTRPMYQEIDEAFLPDFRKNAFDAGLHAGLLKVESTLKTLVAENRGPLRPETTPAAKGRVQATQPIPGDQAPVAHRGNPMMSIIVIVAVLLGALFLFRMIGAIFSASRGGGYGPGYGPGPGPGPGRMGPGGYGPGYGGGGGGGGFMSGLMGGLGGAVAGNWLYDRFSGRHGGYDQGGAGTPVGGEGVAPADPDGGWTSGGGGADWGGGAESGGGGGGDWGGGGGGGDWGGGGGGGGDWGGGGGDGGSW